MIRRRSSVLWLTAALAASGLAGCGDVARPSADGVLHLALSEYRVTPQDVHAASGTLTIYVHNDGRLTHDLVITSADGITEAHSAPIAPGATGNVVAALTPGDYTIASSILDDQALGMYGTLDVGRG